MDSQPRYRVQVLDANNTPLAASPEHVTTIDDVIVLCLSETYHLTPEEMARLYDTVTKTFNRRVLILPAGVSFVRLIRDEEET